MKKHTVFQLVSTKDTEGKGCVYSVLALYPHGDTLISRFVYDITRTKTKAEKLLCAVNDAAPSSEDLIEFIAELL